MNGDHYVVMGNADLDALRARLAAAERVLRGVKAMALQHHGDEDKAALLHALLVEIPAEIDAHLAPAPPKPDDKKED